MGFFFFFQAEDGIRDKLVTGVQPCALPIFVPGAAGLAIEARIRARANNLDKTERGDRSSWISIPAQVKGDCSQRAALRAEPERSVNLFTAIISGTSSEPKRISLWIHLGDRHAFGGSLLACFPYLKKRAPAGTSLPRPGGEVSQRILKASEIGIQKLQVVPQRAASNANPVLYDALENSSLFRASYES